jgi:hypothetical protein
MKFMWTVFLLPTFVFFAVPIDAADARKSNDQQAQNQAEQLAKPNINQEKQQAEQSAKQSLDQEAIAAIKSTREAIDAIRSNHNDQAIQKIEQANGKINVLLARNPATALIPVSAEVRVIDTAPADVSKIREIAADASWAVEGKNFPAARVLLEQLISEVRVRTYNLPLATYPTALQEAARLLDQKDAKQAENVLDAALATLVVVDKVTPIPLVVAREAVNQAQAEEKKDPNKGRTFLQVAKNELQRARELGYAGKDQEYAALNNQIDNLEKQMASHGETGSFFNKLREQLSTFLNRQSQQKNGSTQAERTAQAR